MSIGGFFRRSAYWTTDFFKGRPVRKHYDDIKEVLADSEYGLNVQKEHIDDLLKHATTYSEFYKQYKGKDISQYPVMNKNKLVAVYDDIKIDSKNIPEQKTEDVHVQRTSGSTGTPFAIYQDTRKRNRRVAELKYFGEMGGYKSHEKMGQCRIWTKWQNKSWFQSFRENILAINVANMDEETLINLCETVKKKHVVALLGYASWFEQLSEYLDRNPQRFPSLKVIFTSSEMLKEEVRKHLKEQLGCAVVERYANEEEGILGQQRNDGDCYYLNHASYYFEILKMDSDEPAEYGELGRLVITDLFNYAFPMIRYDTGDAGVWGEPDEHSNGYPVLSKLYGRRLDIIYDTNGDAVHPMSLARILKNFPGISQWQFIQKDKNKYLIKLNLKKEQRDKHDYTDGINTVKEILGPGAEVNIEFVDEIPVLASGKRKPVVCEWQR